MFFIYVCVCSRSSFSIRRIQNQVGFVPGFEGYTEVNIIFFVGHWGDYPPLAAGATEVS